MRKYLTIIFILLLALSFSACSKTDSTTLPPPTEPHLHQFGAWQVTVQPSCAQPGEETRRCECGEFETRHLPLLEHTFSSWTELFAATCTTPGTKERICVSAVISSPTVRSCDPFTMPAPFSNGTVSAKPASGMRRINIAQYIALMAISSNNLAWAGIFLPSFFLRFLLFYGKMPM